MKCSRLASGGFPSWPICLNDSGPARRLKGVPWVLCSADGLSLAAQYSELIAYSITLAYNLRHSASSTLSAATCAELEASTLSALCMQS